MFNIVEKFLSIDGEGPTSGELATFIRFQGCNLRCTWCDTRYSWEKESSNEKLSAKEIYEYIKKMKSKNVTLTGGEPLIQEGIDELLSLLNSDSELQIHIETNGSIDIKPYKEKYENLVFIVDYKLPLSKMTASMNFKNLDSVGEKDVYKFVVGNHEDLLEAYKVITQYNLVSKCLVYFSPVLGKIELEEIVDFLKDKNLNGVRLQVQLHKIIWDKEKRGV